VVAVVVMKAGQRATEETRRKMSEAKKGNQYFRGRRHTETARNNMSKARIGKHHSDETKKKISEAHKRRSRGEDVEPG